MNKKWLHIFIEIKNFSCILYNNKEMQNIIFKLFIIILLIMCFFSCRTMEFVSTIPDIKKYNKRNQSEFKMVIPKGHTDSVINVAFSPDGKYIISSSYDKTVKFWSVDGKLIKTFTGYNSPVVRIAFSSDGKYIVSRSSDGTVKILSMDGRLIRTLKGCHIWVKSIDSNSDGKYITFGTGDKTIKLWNIDGKLIRIFTGHNNLVNSVVISPDGKYIAFGLKDKTIKLLSIDGNLIKNLKGHNGLVNSVAFSPDSKYIISCSGDKTLKLWSINGDLINSFTGHIDSVTDVSFSSDGKYITSSSKDRMKKLWNIDGRFIRNFKGYHWKDKKHYVVSSLDCKYSIFEDYYYKLELQRADGTIVGNFKGKGHTQSILCKAFSPNGKMIATGAMDQTIVLMNIKKRLATVLKGHNNWVYCLAFSSDSKYIVSGSKDNSIKLWSIDGKLIKTFGKNTKIVYSVAYSPDGKYIASGSGKGTVKLWNINGKLIRVFKGHKYCVYDVAFSPDGKYIVSGSGDSTIKLWSINGTLIRTFKGHRGFVKNAAFLDGKYIVSRSEENIKLWSIDGKFIKTLAKASWIKSLAISPNGKYIAAGYYGYSTIKIWNINGKLIQTFKGHLGTVYSLAFSLDGKYIASGSADKSIKLWNINGKCIRTFKGHNSDISCIAFSPDGKYIVSGSGDLSSIHPRDDTIKLWGIDGTLIKTFNEHNGSVFSIAFSPDGKYIVSGSEDTTIKLWNIRNGEYITLLSDSDQWLVYTPDGYFDCSKNGGELVTMVKGTETFAVDQFAVRNNRPDIILKRMKLGDKELINYYYYQYKKRLSKLGFTETQLKSDLHTPETKIIETKQNGKFIDIIFKLNDSKYNLKGYNIYVNDVPVFGGYGKNITGSFKKITETIELTSGKNKIEVTCFNEKGAESFRALTYAEYDKRIYGNLYYIGFGVSKYKDNKLNLKYAHKDAFDLSNLFFKMQNMFSNIFIKTYIDKEVTLENIKKAKEFLKNAKVDDTFVLFIAGHGMHEQDEKAEYYYLTYDTEINNISQTAANFVLLEDLMQGIAPRKKLFLIDTCESGEIEDNIQQKYLAIANSRGINARITRALTLSLKKKDNKKIRTYLYERDRYIYNDLIRRSGAIVFSSSLGGELSYEKDEFKNGLFTEAIIKSLVGNIADKDKNGIVSIDELRNYVMKIVSELSDNMQHPTVDKDNIYQKFGFPIIK